MVLGDTHCSGGSAATLGSPGLSRHHFTVDGGAVFTHVFLSCPVENDPGYLTVNRIQVLRRGWFLVFYSDFSGFRAV